MYRLNQVVVRWDEERTVVLTVRVVADEGAAHDDDWRLEQEIAATIWGAWHCAELEAPREQ